jgi:riboflavin synthase
MFTGLVEIFGTITGIKNAGSSMVLSVKPLSEFEVQLGDSVAVNGVCLTVTKHNGDLAFDVSPETLKSTSLGELQISAKVNLERALRLSDRLGGHIVSGHVDGMGTVRDKKQVGEYTFFTFDSPPEILKYIVKKGSIAIDGISLTVVDLDHRSFSVAIIPHTLASTNLGDKGIGHRVNLEADIIGKYVEKLLGPKNSDASLMGLLKEKGFINE